MSSARDNLVTAAMLLQEAAWLYGAFGVASLMLGAAGSPLAWFAMLAVMGVSLLTARALSLIAMPPLMAYGLQMAAGAAVVYVCVAAQASPEFQGVNLGWPGMLSNDDMSDASRSFTVRAILGSVGGALMWWRGGHIGATAFPAETLGASFKVGVIALAIAAVVDIFHAADLNIFPMMFVFFAAGIAGLSIAHMAAASQKAAADRAWMRVIGGLVAAIVALGLLFSLLQRDALAAIAAPLLWALNMLATAVFYVLIIPLAYLIDFLVNGLIAFFRWLRVEPQAEAAPFAPDVSGGLQMLERGEGEPAALLLLQVLQWSLVAAIVIAALAVMALAYKRRHRRIADAVDGERESVREDADAAYDLANLLFNLLPARFRRRRSGRALRVPSDDPNIADVFRIYFGMLTLAEKRGAPKPSAETPSEYQGALEGIFPAWLARAATRAFERACYGHRPTERARIEEMRAELERAAADGDGKANK